MSFTPSAIAQAVATAAGNNQASLAAPLTALRDSITAGNLAPAAFIDGLRTANAWVAPTLLNSWSNYGSGYNSAGYFLDALGVVHLRGLVTGGVATSTIFTLPSGLRPTARCIFAAINNDAVGRIDVDTSGNVIAQFLTSASWISLDGLTFFTG